MRGAAKSKVVSSGRLTGRVKVQPARRQVTPNPAPAACLEPAYSLYSTDSEDQVTSLHHGLDRCAALLSGILQAEKPALPSLPRAVAAKAAKSRPCTSLGKKPIKKQPTLTAQKSRQSVLHGPGSTTPRTTHQSAVSPAHVGVKLHPPQKQAPTLLRSPSPPSNSQTLRHPSPTQPPPQTSPSPSQPQTPVPPHLPVADCQPTVQTPQAHCKAGCDREEDDFVPVRDTDTQSTATDAHTAVRNTHPHTHTCTVKLSDMQLEHGAADEVPQDKHSREDSSAETQVKVRTVQFLLGELRALIVGQGSVAERLLCHLEQTIASPLITVGCSNIHTEPDLPSLHSQNSQLHSGRILLEEREKAESQTNRETLCSLEVSALQEELTTAQTRLQELQDDLTSAKQLHKALEDTQSQLRDRDAEIALIKTDLEATRRRLLDSEREKSELTLLAQQRLQEIGHLNRTLQSQTTTDVPVVGDSSVSRLTKQHFDQHQHRRDPAERPADCITQYLMSLGQLEPTHSGLECVAAEREGNAQEQRKLASVQLKDTLLHADVRSQRGDKPAETSAHHQNTHVVQSHGLDKVQSGGPPLNSTLSQCDVESVWSDMSTRSDSTFDTRAEVAFRDGLSALDASIASLQRTIQLDLRR
ncbi:coiled-coil domain-containing protein 14 isoform X2 [Sparus aurata]|uniref:coiled-coil domain-containing protein 14 isoform X2 n=1 Tax=Sparus aurata TaxID=8175 RepID=UPI0011C1C37D|nr:coiled-coil domain-containing protein 14 isoform X2 [Sparus aurata]